jgi:hypothetical protein
MAGGRAWIAPARAIWRMTTSSKKQQPSPLAPLRWCCPIDILRVPGHSRQYVKCRDAAWDRPDYCVNAVKYPNTPTWK